MRNIVMVGRITKVSGDKIIHRNSIGGYPIVPVDYDWPICPSCNKEMVLFLQTDLPDGYHLSIFMSPDINEIPFFDFNEDGKPLEEEFWKKREPHFKALYFPSPGVVLQKADEYLAYKKIEWTEGDSQDELRLGGSPVWIQDPEYPSGPDGEKFEFALQIPEDFPFAKKHHAPEQPDSFSADDYCLFLGNEVYVFTSKNFEDPEATWIIVQN